MSLSRSDAGESGAGSTFVQVALESEAVTILPPEISLAGAHFVRSGSDLVVETADGARVLVEGWFAQDRPVGLADHDGATFDADLIDRLAGPLAPGQVAQLDLGPAQPVGQAVTVEGTVSALRADGTAAVLEAGAPLYPGDVLESGPGAVAGLVLVDGTTLAMGENARLVLDEVIYGGGGDDALSLSVLDGVFTLTSGEIAAGDPEAMVISSPSAIAGVRGTRVGIEIDEGGGETWFLLPDIVGNVGSFSLTQKLTGATLLLTDAFQVATPTGGTVRFLVLTPDGIANILGEVLEAEPENETRADNDEPDEEELARLAEAMAAIAPAAGGDGDAADGTIETALDPAVWSFLVDEQTGLVLAFELGNLKGIRIVLDPNPGHPVDPILPVGPEEDPTVRLGDGGVEFIGTDGPDTVIGGAGGDRIFGAGGDDVLDGGAGGDTLDGGPGNDAVFGGEGDDLIIGGSGEGDDLLGGGPGVDTVKFSSATQPIVVDLAAGTASGDAAIGHDVLNGIEHVIGGQAGDSLLGDDAVNSLSGADGNDSLVGRGGDDVLNGGAGSDALDGGEGDDSLVGGAGLDTVDYASAALPIEVDLVAGTASGDPAVGHDVLNGIEHVNGGQAGDTLHGNDAANSLAGGAGGDRIFGAGGD
ncbi:MAG: FecR domain-containing protein, partial [Alphaproteobacteria bacterium]